MVAKTVNFHKFTVLPPFLHLRENKQSHPLFSGTLGADNSILAKMAKRAISYQKCLFYPQNRHFCHPSQNVISGPDLRLDFHNPGHFASF